MKRYDPVEFHDQGGSSLGHMRECPDGDWVALEDVQRLLAAVTASDLDGFKFKSVGGKCWWDVRDEILKAVP